MGDRGRVVVGILGTVDLRVGHRLDHVGDGRRQRTERRHRRLARLERTDVTQDGQDDDLADVLLGHERHRRAVHDVGDGRDGLRRALSGRDEAGQRVGRRRQDEHATDDLADLMESVVEAGHDTEVAAAATDRPEQVRVADRVGPEERAVGGHDLGGQQRVDGQAMGAHEVADPAAEGDATEPDRRGVAKAGGQPVRSDRGRVLTGRQPRLRPGRAALDVDLDRVHGSHVDDDAVVDHAVTGTTMSAAPNGQREPGLTRQCDDPRDVAGIGDLDDERRTSIDVPEGDGACGIEVGVVGRDDPSGDLRLEGRGGPAGRS